MFPCRSRGGSRPESFPDHELSRAGAVAEKLQVTGGPEAAYLFSAAAGRREITFWLLGAERRQSPPGLSPSSAQFPGRDTHASPRPRWDRRQRRRRAPGPGACRAAAEERCRRPCAGPGLPPPSLPLSSPAGRWRARSRRCGLGGRPPQPSRSRRFQESGLAPRARAGASPPLLPAAAPAARATCSATGAKVGPLPFSFFPLPRRPAHAEPARLPRPRRRAGKGRHLSGPAHPAPLPQDGARYDPARPSGPGAMPVAACPQTRGGLGRSRAQLGCAQEGKALKSGPTPAGGSRGPTGVGEGPWRPQSGPGSRPGWRPLLPEPSGSTPPALPCRGKLLRDGNVKVPISHRVTEQRRVKPKVNSGRTKGCPFFPPREQSFPAVGAPLNFPGMQEPQSCTLAMGMFRARFCLFLPPGF